MRPAHAGVLVRDHDALAGVAQGPEARAFDVGDADLGRLDRIPLVDRLGSVLALEAVRAGVRLDPLDVRPGGDVLDDGSIALGNDHVDRPVRLVRHALRVQRRLDRRLRAGSVLLQRVVDVPAASILILHVIGRADIRLVAQVDHERCFLAAGGVEQNLIADLGLAAARRSLPEQSGHADRREHGRGGSQDRPPSPSPLHLRSPLRVGGGEPTRSGRGVQGWTEDRCACAGR